VLYYYNQALKELETWGSERKAINLKKLSESYKLGYTRGKRDLPRWNKIPGREEGKYLD
jgi:predicted patatin/cPLA2 family phospholipase